MSLDDSITTTSYTGQAMKSIRKEASERKIRVEGTKGAGGICTDIAGLYANVSIIKGVVPSTCAELVESKRESIHLKKYYYLQIVLMDSCVRRNDRSAKLDHEFDLNLSLDQNRRESKEDQGRSKQDARPSAD
jgi:hypothetical protein